MPDIDDFILPDTFEELMGQQQEPLEQQPVQTIPGKSMQNINTGRGEKKLDLTEVTIAPTATHLKPTATICPIQPRILSMSQRLERQKFNEERTRNRQFRGHPNFDWGLQYRVLPEGNIYKIQSYNSKLKTYRLKNIALDKQNLTVPYQFITADLNNERDTYTLGLEQNFLREKKKNANLMNRIKFLQNKINQLEGNQN